MQDQIQNRTFTHTATKLKTKRKKKLNPNHNKFQASLPSLQNPTIFHQKKNKNGQHWKPTANPQKEISMEEGI